MNLVEVESLSLFDASAIFHKEPRWPCHAASSGSEGLSPTGEGGGSLSSFPLREQRGKLGTHRSSEHNQNR
jgi:hypothetical protein